MFDMLYVICTPSDHATTKSDFWVNHACCLDQQSQFGQSEKIEKFNDKVDKPSSKGMLIYV